MPTVKNTPEAELQNSSKEQLKRVVEQYVASAEDSKSTQYLQNKFKNEHPEFAEYIQKKPDVFAQMFTEIIDAAQAQEIRGLQDQYSQTLKQIASSQLFTSKDVQQFKESVSDKDVYTYYDTHEKRVRYLHDSIDTYLADISKNVRYYDDFCTSKLRTAEKHNWASSKTVQHWQNYIFGSQYQWCKKIEIIKKEFEPAAVQWEDIGKERDAILVSWEKSNLDGAKQPALQAIVTDSFLDKPIATQQQLLSKAAATLIALEKNVTTLLAQAEAVLDNAVKTSIVAPAEAAKILKTIFSKAREPAEIEALITGNTGNALPTLVHQWQKSAAEFTALEQKMTAEQKSVFNFVRKEVYITWNPSAKAAYIAAALQALRKPSNNVHLQTIERLLSIQHWTAALSALAAIQINTLPLESKERVSTMRRFAETQLALQAMSLVTQASHEANTTKEFEFEQVCGLIRQVSAPLADLYEKAAEKSTSVLQTVMALIVNGIYTKPKNPIVPTLKRTTEVQSTIAKSMQQMRYLQLNLDEEAAVPTTRNMLNDSAIKLEEPTVQVLTEPIFTLSADGQGIQTILANCSANVGNNAFNQAGSITVRGIDKATTLAIARTYHSRLLAA